MVFVILFDAFDDVSYGELYGEILHLSGLLCLEHHSYLNRVLTRIVIHHIGVGSGCIIEESISCIICIPDPEDMTEFMSRDLLVCVKCSGLLEVYCSGILGRPIQTGALKVKSVTSKSPYGAIKWTFYK